MNIFWSSFSRDGFISEYLTDTFNVQNLPENWKCNLEIPIIQKRIWNVLMISGMISQPMIFQIYYEN